VTLARFVLVSLAIYAVCFVVFDDGSCYSVGIRFNPDGDVACVSSPQDRWCPDGGTECMAYTEPFVSEYPICGTAPMGGGFGMWRP
jgi:hypothetical protein